MDLRHVYLNMFNSFWNDPNEAQLEDIDDPMWRYGCSLQPVAYSYSDVAFASDVLMCLDVDITTLAKSLKSICNDSLHWQSHK